MSISGSEPLPDPSGALVAIERYRDLAKYLVTIFAAVGGVLVAGTQLSAIGSLSWDQDPVRLMVAAIGFAIAMIAVVWVVSRTLVVLKPVELSLDQIAADEELSANASRRCALGGLDTVGALRDLLASDLIAPDQVPKWGGVMVEVIDHTALYIVKKRFEAAWRTMLKSGLLGTVGILAFVWAANPGPETRPEPSHHSVPVALVRSAFG